MIDTLPFTDALSHFIVQMGALLLVVMLWWWVTRAHQPAGTQD